MKTIEWRDEFNINVDEIDRQHRRMAELVNELHRAAIEKEDASVVSGVLDELLAYTRHHFKTEERLMLEHEYPDYQAHKNEHDDLLDKLECVVRKISGGHGPVFAAEVDVSADWVMVHMLGYDKPLGAYLNSKSVT